MAFEQLIARLEAATSDERGLFEEAFGAVFGVTPQLARFQGRADPEKGHVARRFQQMLDAQAWESAAMALVPEGREGEVLDFSIARSNLGNGIVRYCATVRCSLGTLGVEVIAATTALALCIAALKAVQQSKA